MATKDSDTSKGIQEERSWEKYSKEAMGVQSGGSPGSMKGMPREPSQGIEKKE